MAWKSHTLNGVLAVVVALAAGASPRLAAPAGENAAREVVVLAPVSFSGAPPPDFAFPEGKTRWDLTALARGPAFTRALYVQGSDARCADSRTGPDGRPLPAVHFADPAGGRAATTWLVPQDAKELLRIGAHETLALDENRGGALTAWRVDLDTVGIGWVLLPAGPHEVVLQRALFSSASRPARLVHRWVDPLVGVVAEISGPVAPDGRSRASIDAATVMENVVAGAATLKIYVDQVDRPTFGDIAYGWDKGSSTTVSSLTPEAYATIGDLVNASTWNFSGNTTGVEVAAITTPINASETCNAARCGYTVSNGKLERRDKGFGSPTTLDKFNAVQQREQRANDVVLWLRAAAQHEGKTGAFGSGESRICYSTDGTGTRSSTPEWLFGHQDAGGFFMQAGDSWFGGPFNCEQDLFNQTCGAAQLFDKLYNKACGTHTGKQTGELLKGGVVTLPSGHTFNALLARTIADYCVFTVAGCSSIFKVDEVRTVVYLWTVPHLGTLVRLQSVQNAADATSFSTLAETDIKFGLFPPRSISVTGRTDTSVTLTWDPGLDTHRINGYRVYWDTDPGATSPYVFNSVANPGQVVFNGASATISGLSANMTYYFTVTSTSNYQDPSTNVTTTYESLLYPTQVSGDPSFVYPVEVQATTTCTGGGAPKQEVTGLTVTKLAGGDIQICWQPTTDQCATGYRVLGLATFPPASDVGWSTLADVGAGTFCWTGNPPPGCFLVVSRGAGGTGPWGHYGH